MTRFAPPPAGGDGDTFGRHVIAPYESGLTHPEILWDLTDLHEGERITFRYESGRRPGMRWRRL